jgi:hypothetical protein
VYSHGSLPTHRPDDGGSKHLWNVSQKPSTGPSPELVQVNFCLKSFVSNIYVYIILLYTPKEPTWLQLLHTYIQTYTHIHIYIHTNMHTYRGQVGLYCVVCNKRWQSEKKVQQMKQNCINSHRPNVVVDWVTFHFRVREVPGSNLGLSTGYPYWGFRNFPHWFQGNAETVT